MSRSGSRGKGGFRHPALAGAAGASEPPAGRRGISRGAALLAGFLAASGAGARMMVEPGVVRQGSYVVVGFPDARGSGAVEAFGRSSPLFAAGGGLRAILPVPLEGVPGRHLIRATIAGRERTGSVRVLRRKTGPVRRLKALTVTPGVAESLKSNRATFAGIVHKRSPRALWSGPWRRPVPGRVTAEFGVRRSYGGGAKWTHKGVDFGMPAGWPVVASAAGVVVHSARMGSYGNTIVLDHGQTVFTTYLHLVSRDVTTGARVEKGQVIGTVGATGLALGAHLHFGVLIDGVAVDPLEFLDRGLP